MNNLSIHQDEEKIVGEAVDGKFSIRIDDALMAAYLSCKLPLGGAPVQIQSILDEAENLGITAALDMEAIEKVLREGGENVLIATGRPSVSGEDGKFISLIPAMKDRSPKLDEQGMADFRELGDIVVVHEGDVLMRLVQATEGEAGETVTGTKLPVKAGNSVAFSTNLEGVFIDPESPDTLVAKISGCPLVVKNGASVEPVYTVSNVDLNSGNITFTGSVRVQGDVRTGMVIKATGDINIDGTVENATLEAGGDIVVQGGVIGDSKALARANLKTLPVIQCKGSFTARFVQNTNITAGCGIFINDVAMLSNLTAGQQIIIGDRGSRKGDIIGGSVRATMLVKAHNFGAPSYVKTIITVGVDQLMLDRHDACIRARTDAFTKLGDIAKLLELARTAPARIPPEKVKSLMLARDSVKAEIQKLNEAEIGMKKDIEVANKAQAVAGKQVFGGTEVVIASKRMNVTTDTGPGIFQAGKDGKVFFA